MLNFMKRRVPGYAWLVFVLVVGLCGYESVPADGFKFGVLYPEAPAPYRDVFRAVLSGIEATGGDKYASSLVIESDASPGEVTEWVQDNRVSAIVVLGRIGVDVCDGVKGGSRVVVGAILSPVDFQCEVYGGITLTPDPEMLFEWARRFQKEIDTITVVYDTQTNDWLVGRAEEAARARGIRLQPRPVDNIQQAARTYKDFIESGPKANHAIWLPQDPYTADQRTILPRLLKASWDDEFVVFSSNPSHVQRGVLFALYPDYRQMGRRLGRMAVEAMDPRSVKNSPFKPLRDLSIAVNLRTADHLGLKLTGKQREAFDLIFPASR
jgi:putative ABC transport system substrate-binding protein